MASAKLANSTVNHSHRVICRVKPMLPVRVTICCTRTIVVIAAPTSTTNMTGFFATSRGCSLTNDWRIAARTSGPWKMLPAPALRVAASCLPSSTSGVRRVGGCNPRVGSASRAGTGRGALLPVAISAEPGQHEYRQHRHLHLEALDLLAQVLRRAADHESGNEHGDDGERQHAVQAGADAAEDHFTQLDVEHRDHA